jgi:hypothetical protein
MRRIWEVTRHKSLNRLPARLAITISFTVASPELNCGQKIRNKVPFDQAGDLSAFSRRASVEALGHFGPRPLLFSVRFPAFHVQAVPALCFQQSTALLTSSCHKLLKSRPGY